MHSVGGHSHCPVPEHCQHSEGNLVTTSSPSLPPPSPGRPLLSLPGVSGSGDAREFTAMLLAMIAKSWQRPPSHSPVSFSSASTRTPRHVEESWSVPRTALSKTSQDNPICHPRALESFPPPRLGNISDTSGGFIWVPTSVSCSQPRVQDVHARS